MARPEILTDYMKRYVTALKLVHPGMKAKEITASLRHYLVNEYSSLEEYAGSDIDVIERTVEQERISQSAIIKHLTEVNRGIKTPSELEKPWNLGMSNRYPVPPDALPVLLDILASDNIPKEDEGVTVRQALWIGRLYRIVHKSELLYTIVRHYAFWERVCEISNIDFDSAEYDRILTRPDELAAYMQDRLSMDISSHSQKRVEQAPDNSRNTSSRSRKHVEQAPDNSQSDGSGIPVDHLIIDGGRIYTTIDVNGAPRQIELPYDDPETLLDISRRQNVIKTIKKREDGTTLVIFRQKVELSFDNKAYNEYLQSLLRYGE